MSDINFALVEDTRPPIYTAMRYWGKKPHNIWRKYIENYTPKNGIFLDPFAGSAISAFEAVKVNRKTIAFDLNPLTSFIIEVFSTKFNKTAFEKEVQKIVEEVQKDKTYLKYYSTVSRKTGANTIAQSFKWENGKLYELGVNHTEQEILEETNGKTSTRKFRYVAKPNNIDQKLAEEQSEIKIDTWFPNEPFINSPSFSANFIQAVGGNNFSNLWTRRNLYVLSKIFDFIKKNNDKNIRTQLLFGFIQSLHLTTKMSVPRRENAKRPFSTSWGRSAFLCANRQMEMNPLLVFEGSCLGKQSVESCLKNVEQYIGKIPKTLKVSKSLKNKNKLSGFDLKYGVVDINTITDYIPEKSIDFIMTDPPYGGLIQYLDLSSIWLNWLKNVDKKYKPNYDAEITVKKGIININLYQQRFTNALKNLRTVLKDEGKIVFTFHNKEIPIWNAFLKSISLAGFKIEKVIHQQNKRTGEANVANPYGTSGTDFYIRCIKSEKVTLKTEKDEFEHFIINKAIEILGLRNEPTPFLFLFNGLLAEISSAGFDLEDFDENVKQILNKNIGQLFLLTENNSNQAGKFWWFVNPSEHIKYPDRQLTERVERNIISLLRRKTSISIDDALAVIYKKYPNGLTPDVKSITSVLQKYGTKSGGRWLYNALEIEQEFTKHTELIFKLIDIGKKLKYKSFVGKREQPEPIKNKRLSDFCDYMQLKNMIKDATVRKRVEMIDLIWLKNEKIKIIFEVENSTNFTSGIQRGSNLPNDVLKIMVIPNHREHELNRISDPLFIESFKKHNWNYLLYSDVDKILQSKASMETIHIFTKELHK
ncbi:MAG: DNA methyltransferase [Polaribacter sp.]